MKNISNFINEALSDKKYYGDSIKKSFKVAQGEIPSNVLQSTFQTLIDTISSIDYYENDKDQKLKDIKVINKMKEKRNMKKGRIKQSYQNLIDLLSKEYNKKYKESI